MKLIASITLFISLIFTGFTYSQFVPTLRIDNDTKDLSVGKVLYSNTGQILFRWQWYRSNSFPDRAGTIFLDTSLNSIHASFGVNGSPLAFKDSSLFDINTNFRVVRNDNGVSTLMTPHDNFPNRGLGTKAFSKLESLILPVAYPSNDSSKIACSVYRLGDSTIATDTLPLRLNALGQSTSFDEIEGGTSADLMKLLTTRHNGMKATFVDSSFSLIDSFHVSDVPPQGINGSNLGVYKVNYLGDSCYLVSGGYHPANRTGILVFRYTYILDRKTGNTRNFNTYEFDSIQVLSEYRPQIQYSKYGEVLSYATAEFKNPGIRSEDWIHFKVADTSGQMLIDTLFQFVPGMSSELFDVVPLNKGRYILIGSVVDTTDFPSFEKDLIFQKIDLQTWKSIGIEEPLASEPLTIFPNPAKEVIRLQTQAELAQYRLWGMNGQTLAKGALDGKQIPVPDLKAGSYLLEVQSLQGNSWIKKVQIAR